MIIHEDIDFPEDPAPYAQILAREPEFTIDMEEARDLGHALLEWVRDHEERAHRRERDRARKLEQLDEAAREVLGDAAALARSAPASVLTLLEMITRSQAINADEIEGKRERRRRERTGGPRIVKRRPKDGAA